MDTSLIFNRTELLVGSETMERYRHTRAIVFGVGGVGSWCAEGLIRSGIGHLTIVDADVVDVTNINRQIMATTATVGQPKAEVLKKRLLEINPGADIVASHAMFTPENAADFNLDSYDYVVDAIDSLRCKLELILLATGKERRFKFFSAMGAALKMDPTQVRVSEFWEVDGCPLAATLRRRMRRQKRFPGRKFRCVWSPEVIRSSESGERSSELLLPQLDNSEPRTQNPELFHKAQTNGSMVHITAIMGFTLAGLVLNDIATKQGR